MEKKESKNRKTKKYIANFCLFAFLVWVTFRVLLKDQNMGELFKLIREVKLPFILLGIGCMVVYFVCESLNTRRTLKELGEKVNIKNCIRYSLIGFFFSAITPAATGGQPMQIYYMHRDGVRASNGTLTLVLNLFSYQVVTISMALISVFFLHSYLDIRLTWLFILGITLNSIALTGLIIGIFSKKLSTALVEFAIKVLYKLKVKRLEEKEKSLRASLDKYNGSAKYIRENKKLILRQFITALIQQVAYYSITVCVFYAFGLRGEHYIKLLGLEAIVHATVSGIPSPGAVGASEGVFVSIFSSTFTDKLINGAMLLNRGIGFYLFVFICGIIVSISIFKAKKEMKQEGITDEQIVDEIEEEIMKEQVNNND